MALSDKHERWLNAAPAVCESLVEQGYDARVNWMPMPRPGKYSTVEFSPGPEIDFYDGTPAADHMWWAMEGAGIGDMFDSFDDGANWQDFLDGEPDPPKARHGWIDRLRQWPR